MLALFVSALFAFIGLVALATLVRSAARGRAAFLALRAELTEHADAMRRARPVPIAPPQRVIAAGRPRRAGGFPAVPPRVAA